MDVLDFEFYFRDKGQTWLVLRGQMDKEKIPFKNSRDKKTGTLKLQFFKKFGTKGHSF